MKISTARLKQIIHEELFYREFYGKTEQITEVESEKQRRYMCAMKDSDDRPEGLSKAEAEEMCTGPMKEASPRNSTIAGTQNLDHLDPEAGDPEEEFFGDKIDHDEVGLQTVELTPDQLKRLRKLTSLKEGFAVSKQDLVNAGLPLGSVRAGLYDRITVRLERVGARRGLPALKTAVRNLESYELNDPSAVLGALEKEL